jgi:hypothetical protein
MSGVCYFGVGNTTYSGVGPIEFDPLLLRWSPHVVNLPLILKPVPPPGKGKPYWRAFEKKARRR